MTYVAYKKMWHYSMIREEWLEELIIWNIFHRVFFNYKRFFRDWGWGDQCMRLLFKTSSWCGIPPRGNAWGTEDGFFCVNLVWLSEVHRLRARDEMLRAIREIFSLYFVQVRRREMKSQLEDGTYWPLELRP